MAEIYSPEVGQHEGLGADLAQLEGEVKVAAFADQESLVGSIEVVEGKVEEVVGELVPIDNPLYNKYTEGIAKKVGEGTNLNTNTNTNTSTGRGGDRRGAAEGV